MVTGDHALTAGPCQHPSPPPPRVDESRDIYKWMSRAALCVCVCSFMLLESKASLIYYM